MNPLLFKLYFYGHSRHALTLNLHYFFYLWACRTRQSETCFQSPTGEHIRTVSCMDGLLRSGRLGVSRARKALFEGHGLVFLQFMGSGTRAHTHIHTPCLSLGPGHEPHWV